jgi:L-cysteine/cystine lyase
MDAARLRAELPVLERIAYLNAGTCGPLPAAARRAVDDVADLAERDGRRSAYYERAVALWTRQRERYAALLGAAVDDVALTTSTSEGLARAVAGLRLGPGDEILTTDGEHPGLVGPIIAAQARDGAVVRTAPLAELPERVGPRTRLVACSHVDWLTGAAAPAFALPDDVALALDGAQGVGAVPVDVRALGCAVYAGSGQKWLCGPVGTGMLYVAPAWRERVAPLGPGYLGFADPQGGFDPAALHPDARRHTAWALAPEAAAGAVAALDVLEGLGWPAIFERARGLAAALAARLAAAGHRVAPRADTTLVAWESADPVATRDRLGAAGVAIRDLPGTGLLRASVGAWNDESDLDRLVAAL